MISNCFDFVNCFSKVFIDFYASYVNIKVYEQKREIVTKKTTLS